MHAAPEAEAFEELDVEQIVPQFPPAPALPAEASVVRPTPRAAAVELPPAPAQPAQPPPAKPAPVHAAPQAPLASRAPTASDANLSRATATPREPAYLTASTARSRAAAPPPQGTAAQILEVFRRPKTLALLGAAGLAGALAALLWPRTDAPSPDASASVTRAEQLPPRAVAACLTRGVHRKLADAVELSVPVIASNGSKQPNGAAAQRVALGFATTATDAVGLTVDPLTLDAAQAFAEGGAAKVSSVAVLSGAAGGKPSFSASRIENEFLNGSAFSLGSGPARVVTTKRGVELGRGSSLSVLWPELSGTETTPPRAESLGDGGAALVLRQGGRSGNIVVGLLDRDGKPSGALTKIAADAFEFGTPTVAASDREILVSFATRKTQTATWRVELARAPLGQRPAASRPFVPADLPEQSNMISPSAAALPGGGWLLQWTEGAEGKYRVRLQTLDASLAPVGAPITVGPDGANAGQGATWAGAVIDNKSGADAGATPTSTVQAVSFYVVRARQGSELWATALECR